MIVTTASMTSAHTPGCSARYMNRSPGVWRTRPRIQWRGVERTWPRPTIRAIAAAAWYRVGAGSTRSMYPVHGVVRHSGQAP